jgi:hypothetical protein
LETTTATNDPLSRRPPRRFQFQIRDVVLVTALVAVLLAGIVQSNVLLLIAFFVAGLVCLVTVWRFRFSPLSQWGTAIACICLLLFLLMPSIGTPRVVGRRSHCANNLKQIGLALHNYHDTYNSFPPAYVCDANGKPMHSWRVLVLPFMEQQALYDQYRFDEPWDGPNNRLLAAQIRKFYSCPQDHGHPGSTETSYVAIVGPGTAWPGEKAATFADFQDGTSNVLLVVEVHNSGIHWMEPRDLHVTQMATVINPPHGQGICSDHEAGAQVTLADGSVRFLKSDTPADVLRSLIHASDGAVPFP